MLLIFLVAANLKTLPTENNESAAHLLQWEHTHNAHSQLKHQINKPEAHVKYC